MKAKLTALAIGAAIILPGSAQAQTFPTHMLKKIHNQRDRTHHFQRLMGRRLTAYHFWAEDHCGNKSCRYGVLKIWTHRHSKAKRRYHYMKLHHLLSPVNGVPASVVNTLECIHPWEDPSWSTSAGGLGYVSPPNSYNVGKTDALASRYGNNWRTWPKAAQIAFGYELQKVYGYKPWSTAYHCV